ncbi:F-actin-capping protein subunit alpha [Clarireedia jacksonii]
MSSQLETVSAFVEGAPPGELVEITSSHSKRTIVLTPTSIDIKALTINTPNLVSQLGPAFEKYNEEQFATVKLPGSSQQVSFVEAHLFNYSTDYYIRS